MAGLQVAGIGSGLDVESIVTQLMAVSRKPIETLDKNSKKIQTQISDMGRMKAAFEKLQNAMKTLSNPTTSQTNLLGLKTASSESTVASAAVNPGASFGNYNLEVISLAQGQKTISNQTFASNTAPITSSESTISIVKGKISGGSLNATTGIYTGATFSTDKSPTDITIAAGASLNDIKDAINKANIGTKASVIFDGTSYQLSLTTTGLGVNESLKITSTGDATVSSLIDYDVENAQNLRQIQSASNLTAKIDGIPVSFPTNTVTDAIAGVTLYAYKTGTASISVSQDTSMISGAITSLTSAWNELTSLYNANAGYNSTTKTAGSLFGDSYLRSTFSQLRQNLFSSTGTPGSISQQFNNLGNLGITIAKNGIATLDSAKLSKALAENPENVYNLFASNNGNLFASAISTLSTVIEGKGLETRIEGLNSRVKSIANQKQSIEDRLANEEKTLRRRFSSLDTMMANMNQTGNFLSQQLSNLNNLN